MSKSSGHQKFSTRQKMYYLIYGQCFFCFVLGFFLGGAPAFRYFTELQGARFSFVLSEFTLKVWMFTKINFRTSYLGILSTRSTKIYGLKRSWSIKMPSLGLVKRTGHISL